jgi:CHAT domain-containing protein
MKRASLPALLLVLMAAGCAVPPPDAYVSSTGGGASGGESLGKNAAGEACTQQVRGDGAGRVVDVYCGTWQQPSGSIRSAGPIDASGISDLATASPWRQALDQRFACGAPQLTTILDGVPAAVMGCRRRQGGWPHVALVAAAGGGASGRDGWYADGVLPALPAIERAVGVQSGRLKAESAALQQSSGADALMADRLAAQAFSSGDIGQYDVLVVAGSRANAAERFGPAESAFRAALALQEKALGAGNPNTATTLERLALQISNQGRTAEADRLFTRATNLAVRSDDPLAAPRLQHYLALHLMNQAKASQALTLLDQAEAGYSRRLPAQVLNARQIRLASSNAAFGDALQNRELLADPTVRAALAGTVEVRRYRALALRALGRTDEADAALLSARTLSAGNNLRDPIELGRLTRMAGIGYADRGNESAAASEFGVAATSFNTALPRSRPLAETRLLQAAIIRKSSGLPAALASCQDGTQILRQESLGVLPSAIAACLDIFAAAADADPAHRQDLLALMFEAAQLAQGGVTNTQIAQATARLAEGARDPKVAEAIRHRQDAGAALTALDRERDARAQSAVGAGQPAADTPEMEARMSDARQAVADADAALQAASPNYGALVQEVAPFAAVFALLRPSEAFIAINLSDVGGWTFLLRDNRITVARVTENASGIAKLVARVRAGVEPTTDTLPRFDTAAATALFKAVLGGVALQIEGATAIVVAPTGPLLSIPFGVLLTGDADPAKLAAAPWLLRKATIAHVPAPANFVSLRKIAGQSRAKQPWFGFGDFRPVTAAQSQRSFPGTECAQSARDFAGLPRLPFATRELEAARSLLGGRREDSLLGPAFTAKAVTEARLKDYRILHFATHALLPAELRCQSEAAIVTSAPAGAADATGALLTVSAVVGLDLDADTVILSACNSGGGAVSAADASGAGKASGESLSGLARAFFYAGARSLMVTHWSVNDQAAAYLVAESMRRVQAGEGINEALRASQLSMLDDAGKGMPAELAHPFYWAPFALIGDGGARKLSTAATSTSRTLQAGL